ncbi:phosphoethanolamine transferase [Providencia rettgeri]|uniref:phosphoethanolamine transferase n=1 Tax=Providencia rettgeri TaxID=587 RepID=UPI000F7880FB|nr:phosphoethanolamine transferase [Providencia rettgeri]ELR5074582.1 phosphoethanolamine transferase [Providencia stuartii]MBV2190240.1 phosphoethanolamine transferase [Providencia rettgeri]
MHSALRRLKNTTTHKTIILFLFVCLSHFALGYEFKLIYAFAVFFFLLSINNIKFIYIPLIIGLSIVSAIYFPIAMLYGEPNFNIAIAILYTDKQESLEFISNIPYYYYIVSIIIFILGYLLTRNNFDIPKKSKALFTLFFITILFQGPVKDSFSNNQFSLLNTGIPEVKFIKQSIEAIISTVEENKRFNDMMSKIDSYPQLFSQGDYDTYVVVIGESVRKDFLHSYGFERQNTPFLDSVNGKIFTNVISPASATVRSLTHTISENIKVQNNIITLAKKAGFYTYWISNQGSVSGADTPVASIGKRADTPIFIKKGSFTSNELDSELIPYIDKAIKQPAKGKKLIVIHLMGSHTPACKRTNDKYDEFYLSKRVSCYVQSVKETDRLLHHIFNDLKSSNEKWSMLYFADHGVSFSNQNTPSKLDLVHGDEYQENYSIPFFITSYNDKDREYITARMSGTSFLSLYSEWLGIDMYQKPNCKFISNQDCKYSNSVLNFENKIIEFDKLARDPIPKH